MVSTPMQHLTAVVLAEHTDHVTRELLARGIVHFVQITELTRHGESHLSAPDQSTSRAQIEEARKRVESLLSLGEITPDPRSGLDVSRLEPVNIDDAHRLLDTLSQDIEEVRNKQQAVQQQILKLEDLSRQFAPYGTLRNVLPAEGRYSFVSVETGTVPKERREDFEKALGSVPSVVVDVSEEDERQFVVLVTMKRNATTVEHVKEQHGFRRADLPELPEGVSPEVLMRLDQRIAELKNEQERLAGQVRSMVDSRKGKLLDLWANLRMNELYLEIQANFSRTSRTVVFSGWVPASQQGEVSQGLRTATAGRCYLEWHTPGEIEKEVGEPVTVPVELRNPRPFFSFQALVENFSRPAYGTIDPTVLVAVAFLMMFGLMFGDAGQGIVIMLLGVTGRFFTRLKERFAAILELLMWCGGAATVTGILFGSYFGFPLFEPLWFDYHGLVEGHPQTGMIQSIYGVLELTIYFGIGVIAVGILLNWINLLRMRRWFDLLFDQAGLLATWIFAGGIWAAFYFAMHNYRELPPSGSLLLVIGVPALAFAVKLPLEHRRERGEGHGGRKISILEYVLYWLIELLELFTRYLSNTLSFLRVAGYGIAHVALMGAFFQIAEMASSGPSFGPLGIAILIVGNALVIVLEGLTAGIQSLRLNYYEFFSKYFVGKGIPYRPVSLYSRA